MSPIIWGCSGATLGLILLPLWSFSNVDLFQAILIELNEPLNISNIALLSANQTPDDIICVHKRNLNCSSPFHSLKGTVSRRYREKIYMQIWNP